MTMNKTSRLQALFQAGHEGRIFSIAGGACAIHARIAEMAGFECAYASGGHASITVLGLPDTGLATLTEQVENAARMNSCISIPLIADADQGFGNAISVRRCVHSYIQAGVAGIHLEDQVIPKRSGPGSREILSLEEAERKIRAAVDAKREIDPDFVIIARSDARGARNGSLEDVIRRLQAYKRAGADVLYPEGLQSREEILAVRAEVEGPMMANFNVIEPPVAVGELVKLGLAAAFHAGIMPLPAIEAAWQAAHAFRAQGAGALMKHRPANLQPPMPHFHELVGFSDILQREEKYLPAPAVDKT